MALHGQLRRTDYTTPRPEDEKYIPDAVRMLLYVACLNYAMLDLETALADAGRLRLLTKHRFNQAQRIVTGTHGTAYDMLQRAAPIAARQYNGWMQCITQSGTVFCCRNPNTRTTSWWHYAVLWPCLTNG